MTEVTEILLAVQSNDNVKRRAAEEELEKALVTDQPAFMIAMAQELSLEDRPLVTRQAAGLRLKNTLLSKTDEVLQMKLNQFWLESITPEVKGEIKRLTLGVLGSVHPEARRTAAQVIARIAAIEIPHKQWPDLIPLLTQHATSDEPVDPNIRQSTLETLGFMCEGPWGIEPRHLQESEINNILTAIVSGMNAEETDLNVKEAAVSALYNALGFIEANFANDDERNYIMRVVCECTQVADSRKVKLAAYQCLVKIAGLYYEFLPPYIQALLNVTFEAIEKEEEAIAQFSLEFWSTLADEEIELLLELQEAHEQGFTEVRQSNNFIMSASSSLVTVLQQCLARQQDHQDETTWNVSTAAGACLDQVSQILRDDFVPLITPFIDDNLLSADWHLCEAAIIAFGSMMNGPSFPKVGDYILKGIPHLLKLQSHAHPLVRDSATWAIGRICEYQPLGITEQWFTPLLSSLLQSLEDREPRVATNACMAIGHLASAYKGYTTYPLAHPWQNIATGLIKAADRPDCTQSLLLSSAYNALDTLVEQSPRDQCAMHFSGLVNDLGERLHQTFSMDLEIELLRAIQGHLCQVLTSLVHKLGKDALAPLVLHQLAALCCQFLATETPAVYEEALMLLGELALQSGPSFADEPNVHPFIQDAISHTDEPAVCKIGLLCMTEVAQAVGPHFPLHQYVDPLTQLLNPDTLPRDLAAAIIRSFAALANVLGNEMIGHADRIIYAVAAFHSQIVDPEYEEQVEQLNDLRCAILECYTWLLQALHGANSAENMLKFIDTPDGLVDYVLMVFADPASSDQTRTAGLAFIGDIAQTLRHRVRRVLLDDKRHEAGLQDAVNMCMSGSEDAAATAKWTKQLLASL